MLYAANVTPNPPSGEYLYSRPEDSKWKSAIDKALWHAKQLRRILETQAVDGALPVLSPPSRLTAEAVSQTEATMPSVPHPAPACLDVPTGGAPSARDIALEPVSPPRHGVSVDTETAAQQENGDPHSQQYPPSSQYDAATAPACSFSFTPCMPGHSHQPQQQPITATPMAPVTDKPCSHRLETPFSEGPLAATPPPCARAVDAEELPVVAVELAPEGGPCDGAETPRCFTPGGDPPSASTSAWTTPDTHNGGCDPSSRCTAAVTPDTATCLGEDHQPWQQLLQSYGALEGEGHQQTRMQQRRTVGGSVDAAEAAACLAPPGPGETFTPTTTAIRLRAAMQWMKLQLQNTPGLHNRPRRHSESSVGPAALILEDADSKQQQQPGDVCPGVGAAESISTAHAGTPSVDLVGGAVAPPSPPAPQEEPLQPQPQQQQQHTPTGKPHLGVRDTWRRHHTPESGVGLASCVASGSRTQRGPVTSSSLHATTNTRSSSNSSSSKGRSPPQTSPWQAAHSAHHLQCSSSPEAGGGGGTPPSSSRSAGTHVSAAGGSAALRDASQRLNAASQRPPRREAGAAKAAAPAAAAAAAGAKKVPVQPRTRSRV